MAAVKTPCLLASANTNTMSGLLPLWLMPILESALGIEHAFDIARASNRVAALTIGLEDYTADLGVAKTRGGEESAWARARVVNAAHAAGVQLEIHQVHAQELEGPWRPHASNPVKIDVCSARSAGTPFLVDCALFRPAQDCSRSYGGRITINRVQKLSPTEFLEEIERAIGGGRGDLHGDLVGAARRCGGVPVVAGDQRADRCARARARAPAPGWSRR